MNMFVIIVISSLWIAIPNKLISDIVLTCVTSFLKSSVTDYVIRSLLSTWERSKWQWINSVSSDPISAGHGPHTRTEFLQLHYVGLHIPNLGGLTTTTPCAYNIDHISGWRSKNSMPCYKAHTQVVRFCYSVRLTVTCSVCACVWVSEWACVRTQRPPSVDRRANNFYRACTSSAALSRLAPPGGRLLIASSPAWLWQQANTCARHVYVSIDVRINNRLWRIARSKLRLTCWLG